MPTRTNENERLLNHALFLENKSEGHYGVDDSYWCSGHMVNGQGQTAGLCTHVVPSITFYAKRVYVNL